MAWCHQTTSHYLSQCWPRSLSLYGITKQQWVKACSALQPHSLNTLRPRQNGRLFADVIFTCIFLNEKVWISINISLKFVPEGQINNIPVLVQIMAWRRPGDKPLFEPMMFSLLTHICVTRPQWVKMFSPQFKFDGNFPLPLFNYFSLNQHNFCTCHENTAVVSRAKFCSDHSISSKIKYKHFHQIWIVMEKIHAGFSEKDRTAKVLQIYAIIKCIFLERK